MRYRKLPKSIELTEWKDMVRINGHLVAFYKENMFHHEDCNEDLWYDDSNEDLFTFLD